MRDKIIKELHKLSKDCFKLSLTGERSPKISEMKFGGRPYTELNETMPLCPHCQKELTFVFQFYLGINEKLQTAGSLYVFYYCFECTPIGGLNEEGMWQMRIYDDPTNFIVPTETNNNLVKNCAVEIIKTKILPDFETIEEKFSAIAQMCEELSDDPLDLYTELGSYIGCEMEPFSSIGGYPIWIQGEARKICPKCHTEMNFICQIDSEEKANLEWGDAGCLYIFQCKKDLDTFAIEMQCF